MNCRIHGRGVSSDNPVTNIIRSQCPCVYASNRLAVYAVYPAYSSSIDWPYLPYVPDGEPSQKMTVSGRFATYGQSCVFSVVPQFDRFAQCGHYVQSAICVIYHIQHDAEHTTRVHRNSPPSSSGEEQGRSRESLVGIAEDVSGSRALKSKLCIRYPRGERAITTLGENLTLLIEASVAAFTALLRPELLA